MSLVPLLPSCPLQSDPSRPAPVARAPSLRGHACPGASRFNGLLNGHSLKASAMSTATLHPLASLVAPSASAQAQATQAPPASPVSLAAATLLDQFGQAETTQSRVMSLYYMAHDGLTNEEFDEACGEASALAKQADKANGWIIGDKKGRDAYGPRQSSLATQQTGMRQVFGVFRMQPDAIVKPGPSGFVNMDVMPVMSRAVTLAAAWLNSTNEDGTKVPCNWRGIPLSQEKVQKARKSVARADAAAFDAAAAEHPQQAGEDDAQYEKRIEALMPQYAEKLKGAAVAEIAAKLWKKLVEKHGAADAESIVIELNRLSLES